MIRLKVEDRDLWVRTEDVIAVGTGWKEVPPEPTNESDQPTRVLTTMVTVAHVGTVPVDQEVSAVLDMIGVDRRTEPLSG